MCVNIIEICFGLCLVWIMPRGRATILEHIKAAHVQCNALHWMWQGHQQSKFSCHNHMEHDRLKDVCTGCGDVYNTMDHIVHHDGG